MKKLQLLSALFLGSLITSPAFAAAKTYQVTGPIVEVTDETITIEKGKEKWQVDRTKDTKVTGDLKVGTKVTVQYRMSAESIEAKAGAKDAKDAKAAKPADKASTDAKAPEAAPKAEPTKPAAKPAEAPAAKK